MTDTISHCDDSDKTSICMLVCIKTFPDSIDKAAASADDATHSG